MREIRLVLEDNEHRHLQKQKGFQTWKEFFVKPRLQQTDYEPKKGRG